MKAVANTVCGLWQAQDKKLLAKNLFLDDHQLVDFAFGEQKGEIDKSFSRLLFPEDYYFSIIISVDPVGIIYQIWSITNKLKSCLTLVY